MATVESCEYIDSIEIIERSLPLFDLGADTSICIDKPLRLDLSAIGDSHLWSDGTTDPQLSIDASGLYWLRIAEDNCFYSDSIQISIASEDCSCNVYVPNVINSGTTPNNSFRPFFSCDVATYNLEIYNRWGNLVFTSDDPDVAWLTDNFGQDLSSVYIYSVSYSYSDNEELFQKTGTLTLLK